MSSIQTFASASSRNAELAYQRGDVDGALALQHKFVAGTDHQEPLVARDFLLLAFFLQVSGRIDEALPVVRRCAELFPDDASVQENLGVLLLWRHEYDDAVAALERALALGSCSNNVLDSLCGALHRLGKREDALRYGRKSLEAKDVQFGGGAPLVVLPQAPPPCFDPSHPEENVISYCLWGDNPRYLSTLLENLYLRPHIFPAWTIRVYVDASVSAKFREQLVRGGAQIIDRVAKPSQPPSRRLLWRFEVISDPTVKRFLIRDADSLLTVKERCAVDDWVRSDKYFHLMRDFHSHTDLILAGMWGGVGGILPSPDDLLKHFKPWRLENDHIDQDLLTATAWPIVRQSCLSHDSIFVGCLGSLPFPPYGELPARYHVGQNEFERKNFEQKVLALAKRDAGEERAISPDKKVIVGSVFDKATGGPNGVLRITIP